jgi:HK97 family phage portal protein
LLPYSKDMALSIFGLTIQRRSLGNPAITFGEWLDGLDRSKSSADITVTDQKSLRISTVYAAIKVISETIAELPIDLFRRNETSKERVFNDIDYLIGTAPNDKYTSYSFRQALQACVLLYGNGYALIEFNSSMTPKSLTLLNPTKVQPKVIEETGEVMYVIGGDKPVEPFQMLHIKGMSIDGVIGLSPIDYHKEVYGSGLALQETGNRFFANGTLATGIVTKAAAIDPAGVKALRKQFKEHYSGRKNQHGVLVLDAGMDFKQLSVNPDQAQFLESKKFNVEDIARLFRIPPHMVGDLSRATNNNIEHQSLEFVKYTMLPWIKQWEQELDRKLLKKDRKHQFKFNLNALLRGDTRNRAEYYVKMLQNGVLSPNEVRMLENMNPRDGGDIYLTPLNLTTNPERYEEGNTNI